MLTRENASLIREKLEDIRFSAPHTHLGVVSMFTETWVGGFNVNVFAKWASTGVGCGGVCAPGVGVLRRYNPGFPGSKISLINGRGLKQGADLNKPSDPRALSAFPQHRGSKSPTRSVRDRAGAEADGARGLPSAETARRPRRAKAKSIQQATPSPILHLCSLAVPTSATTFPPERRRLRDLRWDGGRGKGLGWGGSPKPRGQAGHLSPSSLPIFPPTDPTCLVFLEQAVQ